MSSTKIILPEDFEKRLHALTICHAQQSRLLSTLFLHQSFFVGKEGLEEHQVISSVKLIDLDKHIKRSGLLMDDLMFHVKVKQS